MAKMYGKGLVLESEPNCEREDCSDVWVSFKGSNDMSSYAVAVNEGVVDADRGERELSRSQLDWLNGQEVQDFLDSVNY